MILDQPWISPPFVLGAAPVVGRLPCSISHPGGLEESGHRFRSLEPLHLGRDIVTPGSHRQVLQAHRRRHPQNGGASGTAERRERDEQREHDGADDHHERRRDSASTAAIAAAELEDQVGGEGTRLPAIAVAAERRGPSELELDQERAGELGRGGDRAVLVAEPELELDQ